MRSILIAALLAATAANAESAFMDNESGGRIVLTGKTSTTCGENRRIAYASSRTSRTVFGCWINDDVMVHVEWEGGEFRSYNIEDFQFRGD